MIPKMELTIQFASPMRSQRIFFQNSTVSLSRAMKGSVSSEVPQIDPYFVLSIFLSLETYGILPSSVDSVWNHVIFRILENRSGQAPPQGCDKGMTRPWVYFMRSV